MTVLIAVAGAAPGVGKSTVCDRLCRRLADLGVRVDHFREEEILTRAEFAPVAAEFTASGVVAPATLLASTAEYVASVQAARMDVVVADALVPFVPSLVAWGYEDDAIGAFLDSLTELLAPVHPVLVYLDGDPRRALRRAVDREGPGWLDWYVGKLAGYSVTPTVHDFDSACGYLDRERQTTLRLIAGRAWRLVVVDRADQLGTDEVSARVLAGVGPAVHGSRPPANRT